MKKVEAASSRLPKFLFYISGAGETLAPQPEAADSQIVVQAASLQRSDFQRPNKRQDRAATSPVTSSRRVWPLRDPDTNHQRLNQKDD